MCFMSYNVFESIKACSIASVRNSTVVVKYTLFIIQFAYRRMFFFLEKIKMKSYNESGGYNVRVRLHSIMLRWIILYNNGILYYILAKDLNFVYDMFLFSLIHKKEEQLVWLIVAYNHNHSGDVFFLLAVCGWTLSLLFSATTSSLILDMKMLSDNRKVCS